MNTESIVDNSSDCGVMVPGFRRNHQSQGSEAALPFCRHLNQIEKPAMDRTADERRQVRQGESGRLPRGASRLDGRVARIGPQGSAMAIDHSVNASQARVHFLGAGDNPVDNNWSENRIHPVAQGRSAGLFASSLRAGKRSAAIMSLICSAKLNGHDPYAYLKDVLTRRPTPPASRIEGLLPHFWQSSATR